VDQSDIIGPDKMVMPGSQHFLLYLAVWLGAAALLGLAVAVLVRWHRKRRGRPAKRPVVSLGLASVVVAALVVGLLNKPSPFFVPEFPALPRLFPEQAFFYRPTSDVPVAEGSADMVAALGSMPIGAGASGEVTSGIVWGFPFNFVDESTPRHRMSMTYPGSSDDVPYPISDPAYVQSMPSLGIDNHYIAIDLEADRMWELWAIRNWFGRWAAGSGAEWDLTSTDYAAGSAVAAGLPIMPLTHTYEEVASGRIDHVLSGATANAAPTWVWPARHSDGPSSDPDAPPMGTWLRLRADADLSGLGPQARVIATAMQEYGIVLVDTTSAFGLAGTPDARWDNDDLATLGTLNTDDLEVIDSAALMVDTDSMAARQPE
jgi:hypothetical protein